MIKRTLILAALVCAMAGEMYASNTETQVVNPQPESVRILQEQMLLQKVASNIEVTFTVEFDITIMGETYHVVGSIHIGNERAHFVEAELNVYDANGNLRYHLESTYNENGERTGLIVTNPSGEILENIPSEINAIMDEVD